MKCLVCKHGDLVDGHTTVTLERGETILVIKKVPAHVCSTCGEDYIDDSVTARILAEATAAAEAGVEMDVRQYVA